MKLLGLTDKHLIRQDTGRFPNCLLGFVFRKPSAWVWVALIREQVLSKQLTIWQCSGPQENGLQCLIHRRVPKSAVKITFVSEGKQWTGGFTIHDQVSDLHSDWPNLKSYPILVTWPNTDVCSISRKKWSLVGSLSKTLNTVEWGGLELTKHK